MMLGEEKSTVTVDLGDQQETLEERMASGRYSSPSEVVQEALQALDREDALIEGILEDRMQDALDDPQGGGDRPVSAPPAHTRLPGNE